MGKLRAAKGIDLYEAVVISKYRARAVVAKIPDEYWGSFAKTWLHGKTVSDEEKK